MPIFDHISMFKFEIAFHKDFLILNILTLERMNLN